jgi:acyl-CoA synthetase (AMP-forming)/AMP-acid ligase II
VNLFSPADSDALHVRVQAFLRAAIVDPARTPESFDALAVDLARHQAAHIPAVARLARARGIDLASATRAAEVPAVPCDVFRLTRVAAHPIADDVALFRTSGTSQGREARGEHALRTTATYELGARLWAERLLWPDTTRLRAIVLAPPLAEQPDSSLGFMLDRFAALLGGGTFHLRSGALDAESVALAAASARAANEPALVLATSFALVHLLDARRDRDRDRDLDLRLPPGSRVMQTGGFKGRSREVAPDELRAAVSEAFAVPEAQVIGEYGMTELSSQLYETTLAAALGKWPANEARHGVYAAPPWVRVTAVDPVTLAALPDGEIGIARLVDLANVDSAVAIQTADRVRVLPGSEGNHSIELLGRAPGAPPRGCSIAIDDMLGPP